MPLGTRSARLADTRNREKTNVLLFSPQASYLVYTGGAEVVVLVTVVVSTTYEGAVVVSVTYVAYTCTNVPAAVVGEGSNVEVLVVVAVSLAMVNESVKGDSRSRGVNPAGVGATTVDEGVMSVPADTELVYVVVIVSLYM